MLLCIPDDSHLASLKYFVKKVAFHKFSLDTDNCVDQPEDCQKKDLKIQTPTVIVDLIDNVQNLEGIENMKITSKQCSHIIQVQRPRNRTMWRSFDLKLPPQHQLD